MTKKKMMIMLLLLPMISVGAWAQDAASFNDVTHATEASEVAEEKEPLYQGYIGGMMVHMGYGYGGTLSPKGTSSSIPVSGLMTGIGGKIAVRLGKHLKVGTEGYVSALHYGDNREASLGWGGLLVDYGWQLGKWNPYFGVSIGGGAYENTASLDSPLNDYTPQPTVIRKYGVFIVDPYIAVDYSITSRLKISAKVDWIMSPTVPLAGSDFSSGPRFYIGFMFSH